jgi:hypothetical protein
MSKAGEASPHCSPANECGSTEQHKAPHEHDVQHGQ